MSYFEDTIDGIENWFIANPEEVSLLVGLVIEAENLIEKTLNEINRGMLVALKKPLQNNNLTTQVQNQHFEKIHAQDRNRRHARNND